LTTFFPPKRIFGLELEKSENQEEVIMKSISKNLSTRVLKISLLLLWICPLISCFAPVFSELQSARLAGPGNAEITPSYSRVNGESEHVQDHFGIQAGYGISRRLDFRLRYEYASVGSANEDTFGVNMLGFGPKLSLVKDWLAIYLPVGFAFGEDIDVSETWQAHPTLLATLPLSQYFEINSSAKVLIPLQKGNDPMYAVNIGFAIGPDIRRWAVRPEIGFLFNSWVGNCLHMSIGLSFSTDLLKGR
jgi:hypothetical protein